MSHEKYAVMDRFEKKMDLQRGIIDYYHYSYASWVFDSNVAQLTKVLYGCSVTRIRETSPYFYTQGL